ncbi:MAG: hypothetical protein ACXABY_15170 [Candidatus Thorarchaeota archaeon]
MNRLKPLMGYPIVYRVSDLESVGDIEAAIRKKHKDAREIRVARHGQCVDIGVIPRKDTSC